MATKSTKSPELRRVSDRDKNGCEQAKADGFRFIDTHHDYELAIGKQLPSPPVFIRYARRTIGYKTELYICRKIALAELRHSRLYSDSQVSFEVAQQIYNERLSFAFEHSKVLVAEYRDKIIGFVSLRENRIDLIAVTKSYQRHGIGTKLIEACVNECRIDDYDTIRVATHGSNREARNFYEKCGFKQIKESKDFHR